MRDLLLQSITLVSRKEKTAKKVSFHPKRNLIIGKNDTGKSCLLKSIYYAFGAEPPQMHPDWLATGVSIHLRFTIDRKAYSIYRNGNSYSLFDDGDKLIQTFDSVTTGIGPKLAELLGFNLKLLNHQKELITPPPAYLFLPFYIDQDTGWGDTWNSFSRLAQLPRWKKPLIDYFLGMRPDEWYRLSAKKQIAQDELDEPRRLKRALEELLESKREELVGIDFDVNIVEFKKEIRKLLDACNELKKVQSKYREMIIELRTEQIRLEAQIDIVKRTRDDLQDDQEYALSCDEGHLDCPTCGAQYDNSFNDRFGIAKDTATCSDLLSELREGLHKVKNEIQKHEDVVSESHDRQIKIERALASRQGKVKLKDLIKLHGKREVVRELDAEVEALRKAIFKLEVSIEGLIKEMAVFDDRERKKRIKTLYGQRFKDAAQRLNVTKLPSRVFKEVGPKIAESGSDLPRAILAYQFSILSIISETEDLQSFPLVVDAPIQQEQDDENLEKILSFISNSCPGGYQLILGLVDSVDFELDGELIELGDKYALMGQENYDMLSKEIEPFETMNLLF